MSRQHEYHLESLLCLLSFEAMAGVFHNLMEYLFNCALLEIILFYAVYLCGIQASRLFMHSKDIHTHYFKLVFIQHNVVPVYANKSLSHKTSKNREACHF